MSNPLIEPDPAIAMVSEIQACPGLEKQAVIVDSANDNDIRRGADTRLPGDTQTVAKPLFGKRGLERLIKSLENAECQAAEALSRTSLQNDNCVSEDRGLLANVSEQAHLHSTVAAALRPLRDEKTRQKEELQLRYKKQLNEADGMSIQQYSMECQCIHRTTARLWKKSCEDEEESTLDWLKRKRSTFLH